MRIVILPLAALTLLVGPHSHETRRVYEPALAPAQDTAVVHVSGGSIDSAFRSLAASKSVTDLARDLPTGDVARYQLVVLSRRATGPAELHNGWSDVVIVRSGAAVLRTGRVLAGRTARGAGEYSGSAIPGSRDQVVGPGDMLVIPARLAHQWRPTGTEAFSYVVLKVRPGRSPGTIAE